MLTITPVYDPRTGLEHLSCNAPPACEHDEQPAKFRAGQAVWHFWNNWAVATVIKSVGQYRGMPTYTIGKGFQPALESDLYAMDDDGRRALLARLSDEIERLQWELDRVSRASV